MKIKSTLLILLSLSLAGVIRSQPALDESVSKLISNRLSLSEELYYHFHQNPELSFLEKNTSSKIAQELKQLGFAVTEKVGGYGVVGVMQNGNGPTVMLRADTDALPIKEETGVPYASKVRAVDITEEEVPVMHACGHGEM